MFRSLVVFALLALCLAKRPAPPRQQHANVRRVQQQNNQIRINPAQPGGTKCTGDSTQQVALPKMIAREVCDAPHAYTCTIAGDPHVWTTDINYRLHAYEAQRLGDNWAAYYHDGSAPVRVQVRNYLPHPTSKISLVGGVAVKLPSGDIFAVVGSAAPTLNCKPVTKDQMAQRGIQNNGQTYTITVGKSQIVYYPMFLSITGPKCALTTAHGWCGMVTDDRFKACAWETSGTNPAGTIGHDYFNCHGGITDEIVKEEIKAVTATPQPVVNPCDNKDSAQYKAAAVKCGNLFGKYSQKADGTCNKAQYLQSCVADVCLSAGDRHETLLRQSERNYLIRWGHGKCDKDIKIKTHKCHTVAQDGRSFQLPAFDNVCENKQQATCTFSGDPHLSIRLPGRKQHYSEAMKEGFNWAAYYHDGAASVKVQILNTPIGHRASGVAGFAVSLDDKHTFRYVGHVAGGWAKSIATGAFFDCKKITKDQVKSLEKYGITKNGKVWTVKVGNTHIQYSDYFLSVTGPTCAMEKAYGWCGAATDERFYSCSSDRTGTNPAVVRNRHNLFDCKGGVTVQVEKQIKEIEATARPVDQAPKCTALQLNEFQKQCRRALKEFDSVKCPKIAAIKQCKKDMCLVAGDMATQARILREVAATFQVATGKRNCKKAIDVQINIKEDKKIEKEIKVIVKDDKKKHKKCGADKLTAPVQRPESLLAPQCNDVTPATCMLAGDPHVYQQGTFQGLEAMKDGFNWMAYYHDGIGRIRVQTLHLPASKGSLITGVRGLAIKLPNGKRFKVDEKGKAWINCQKADKAALKQLNIIKQGHVYDIVLTGRTTVKYIHGTYGQVTISSPKCALNAAHGWCGAATRPEFRSCSSVSTGVNAAAVSAKHNYFQCNGGRTDDIIADQQTQQSLKPKIPKCGGAAKADATRRCKAVLEAYSGKRCSKLMFVQDCVKDVCLSPKNKAAGLLRNIQRRFRAAYAKLPFSVCEKKLTPEKRKCHQISQNGKEFKLPKFDGVCAGDAKAKCTFSGDPHLSIVGIGKNHYSEAMKEGINWAAYFHDGRAQVKVQLLNGPWGVRRGVTYIQGFAVALGDNVFRVIGTRHGGLKKGAFYNCKRVGQDITAAELKQFGITKSGASWIVKIGRTKITYQNGYLSIKGPACGISKAYGWCGAATDNRFNSCSSDRSGANPAAVRNKHNLFGKFPCTPVKELDRIVTQDQNKKPKEPKKCSAVENKKFKKTCQKALKKFDRTKKGCKKNRAIRGCIQDLCLAQNSQQKTKVLTLMKARFTNKCEKSQKVITLIKQEKTDLKDKKKADNKAKKIANKLKGQEPKTLPGQAKKEIKKMNKEIRKSKKSNGVSINIQNTAGGNCDPSDILGLTMWNARLDRLSDKIRRQRHFYDYIKRKVLLQTLKGRPDLTNVRYQFQRSMKQWKTVIQAKQLYNATQLEKSPYLFQ